MRTNKNIQNNVIPIKQHETKGLYTIIKSCDFIVKYINLGITIFKHFLFEGLYNCRITDYNHLYGILLRWKLNIVKSLSHG